MCSLPDIVKIMNQDGQEEGSCSMHVKIRNVYKILDVTLRRRRYFGYLYVSERTILKYILDKLILMMWTGWNWFWSYCEHGDKLNKF
jgi:hypothetical protein